MNFFKRIQIKNKKKYEFSGEGGGSFSDFVFPKNVKKNLGRGGV